MAVPAYNTDLNTIVLCETGDSFEEFSGYALGDNADLETDWYLQGNSCASDEANNKTGVGHSIGFDYGSGITFATGDCVFAWMMCMAGNAMDTFDNGGYRVLIGNTTSAFYGWKVGGRDFGRNPYGGWTNVVVDPTYTPRDYTTGSPNGTWQHFAVAFNLTSGISKGRPNCMDAMRYGRGELQVTAGSVGDGYATFSGMAAANDSSTARWGLFQSQAGIYLWKGLMSLGTASTAVAFVDSNVNISIDDTPRTYDTFNKIEIVNSSSSVDWTGVNITAINASGLSVGTFEVVDDATINFDTCVFTDMATFSFYSTATSQNMLSCTWRRCETVTQGLAEFDGCIFDNSGSTSSLHVSDLDLITNCDFISDGSNHAMELDSNHAGGSFTLLNCTYTDYAESDGSTGNECIFNNSGGAVTINVSGGDVPTIRNGDGATTTVVASIVWNFEIKNASNEIVSGSEFRIYNSGTQTQVFGVETSDGTETYSFDQSLAGSNVDIVVHTVDTYLYFRQTQARPSSNTTTTLVLTVDRWYSNPT